MNMKANKVTLNIHIEVLDIAAARGVLMQAIELIDGEIHDGMLSMTDGDQVKWNVQNKQVEI